MNVLTDEWSGLFSELLSRVNDDGRKSFLQSAIEDVKVITLANFGEFGDGMMRPWHDEILLSESYKRTLRKSSGRTVATLERDEDERESCVGTEWEGGTGAHLIDSFTIETNTDFAILTNTSDYASTHQLGEGVPRRPFFPIDESGQLMPAMEQRIFGIADSHFQV